MKKSNPREIHFGYQKPINIKRSKEKYFSPLWHFHSEYELVYIENSFGKKFIGDHIGKFKSGDLYFIGNRLPHMWVNDNSYFQKDSKKFASSLVIHFTLNFLSSVFMESEICENLNILLRKANRGLEIMGNTKDTILMKLISIETFEGLSSLANLLEILELLLKHNDYKVLSSAGYENTFIHNKSERINSVNEYIMSHFRKPISLQNVADLTHMNVTSFCRYFKMKTQQSFNQYLINFRIGHAKKLLIHTDLNISQICFEIGFNNLANFNRHFKKRTLFTPKAYRESMENKVK